MLCAHVYLIRVHQWSSQWQLDTFSLLWCHLPSFIIFMIFLYDIFNKVFFQYNCKRKIRTRFNISWDIEHLVSLNSITLCVHLSFFGNAQHTTCCMAMPVVNFKIMLLECIVTSKSHHTCEICNDRQCTWFKNNNCIPFVFYGCTPLS